jgi:hypothetical protein
VTSSLVQDEYAEQLQFEDDEEAANLASKRRRIDEIDSSDGVLDAETAWAIGFTPHSMTSEEEDLLPVGADEGVYTSVMIPPFRHLCLPSSSCGTPP